MHLTRHTDYALRALMFIQARAPHAATVKQISDFFGTSYHHQMKVVQHLTLLGYVATSRGRGGGVRLAQAPATIKLGKVVRQLEPSLNLAECFDHASNACRLSPACTLKRALYEARAAFFGIMDAYSLADLALGTDLQSQPILAAMQAGPRLPPAP